MSINNTRRTIQVGKIHTPSLESGCCQIIVRPLISEASSAEATSLWLVVPLFTANTFPTPEQVVRIILGLDSSETRVIRPIHGALPIRLIKVTLRQFSKGNSKSVGRDGLTSLM